MSLISRKLFHLPRLIKNYNNLSTTTSTSPHEQLHSLNNISTTFEQLVGNTRLVYLKHFSHKTGCNIFGKCEFENPGGSVKDRTALSLILQAEKKGNLKRGEPGIIVEGTAGNTGIGLALAAGVFGYDCVICIANTQSIEKKNYLRWAGAHLVEVPAVPYSDPNNYVHVAKRLSDSLSNSSSVRAFYSNQWDNLDNRKAHFENTGPEILTQIQNLTGGGVDAFSCAVGTGGTLSGVGRYLKSQNASTKVCLTDPMGAGLVNFYRTGVMKSFGSSISEGIGQNRVTGNLGDFVPDYAFEVNDTEMILALNDLQRHEGLALGTSAGINVAGTLKVAEQLGFGSGKNIVTVLCDLGQRYASKIYNEKFLLSKSLPVAEWLRSRSAGENSERGYDLNALLTSATKEAIN